MKKSALSLVCGLILFLNISQAQEVIIGKEDLSAPEFPLNPANFFNYQYNQFIYKQQWIHANGKINKVAYYYKGHVYHCMDNNISGELMIDLFSQTGSKVLNIKFVKTTEHFQTQIDLSGQSKGMYLINLSLDKFRAVRKLLVD